MPGDAEIATRFWGKVRKTSDCWTWTASTQGGYGVFAVTSRHNVYAHRFAYENVVGPIPRGLDLDHQCNNRSCVRPEHLKPATNKANVLRGVGPTAINARKTTCMRGHPLVADTRPSALGLNWRRCSTCAALRQRGALCLAT